MADGLYEWEKKGKVKQPFYVVKRDRSSFAFAGLWERWQPPDGSDSVESCTIITTKANALVGRFHDRMPDPEDFDLWLHPNVTEPEGLLPLLKPHDAERMAAFPVSREVNTPAKERASLIEPAEGSGA